MSRLPVQWGEPKPEAIPVRPFKPTINWAGLHCEVISETAHTLTLRTKDGHSVTVNRSANLYKLSGFAGL